MSDLMGEYTNSIGYQGPVNFIEQGGKGELQLYEILPSSY